MLELDVNGEKLVVSSDYDSGTHMGFTACVIKPGEYVAKNLNEVLTRDEIKYLEMLLASAAADLLKSKALQKSA